MFERILVVLFAFLVWYSLPPDVRKWLSRGVVMFERILVVLFVFLVWYSLPPDVRKWLKYQLEDDRIATNAMYGRYEAYDIVSAYPDELFDGTIVASLIEREK